MAAGDMSQVDDGELPVGERAVEELPLSFLVMDDAGHRGSAEGDRRAGEDQGVGRDGEGPARRRRWRLEALPQPQRLVASGELHDGDGLAPVEPEGVAEQVAVPAGQNRAGNDGETP